MTAQTAERRPMGALGRMGMVAALHGAVLYLIASSLGIVPSLIPEPPIATQLIDEVRPVEPPVEPVDPRFSEPQVYVPTPVAPTSDEADPETQIITQRNDDPPVIPDVVPVAPSVQLVGVRADSRHPLTQPAYPLTDVRQGNEGAVELEIYVLPSGRVGDVRVIKSTGSPTLDQSAMEEARRKWRLLPAMRDGEPYAQWHRLRVVFNLKDR